MLSRKPHSRVIESIVVVGLLAAGGEAPAQPSRAGGTALPPAADARPRVAVAPFANMSGRPADDWLGAGIAETVISGMQRSGGLSVVDRWAGGAAGSGAGPVAGAERVRAAARDAGVSWLVAGGFQRAAERLRITARVIDVETGAAREVAQVDGRADELFALQDQVVTEVAQGLAGLTAAASAAPRAASRTSSGAGARPDPGGSGAAGRGGSFAPPGGIRAPATRTDGAAGAGARRAPGGPGASGRGGPFTPPVGVRAAGAVAAGSRPAERASRPAAAEAGPVGGVAEPAPAPAGDAGVLAGRVTVRPRRTANPPTVDGLLDDAVWGNAARISRFVQREPLREWGG